MNGLFYPGSEVFNLYAEKGLPPEISVMLLSDRGYTVEWPSFISAAISNGWSYKKIFTTITTAVKEADIFTESQLAEFTEMAKRFFAFAMAKEGGAA